MRETEQHKLHNHLILFQTPSVLNNCKSSYFGFGFYIVNIFVLNAMHFFKDPIIARKSAYFNAHAVTFQMVNWLFLDTNRTK